MSTLKAQKIARDKATVWVEFLSPPSDVGKQNQLYPKGLEPKNEPAQGADFSLLTAEKTQFPNCQSCTRGCRSMRVQRRSHAQVTPLEMNVSQLTNWPILTRKHLNVVPHCILLSYHQRQIGEQPSLSSGLSDAPT